MYKLETLNKCILYLQSVLCSARMAEGGGESIKVVVRVRGLIAREGGEAKAFTTEDSTDLVQQSNKKRWTFDRVYSPKEDTRSV